MDPKIPEIFCNGIIRIEMIGGGCARFTLGSNCVCDDSSQAKAVAYIIAPLAAVPNTIKQLTTVLLWGERESDEDGLHVHH